MNSLDAYVKEVTGEPFQAYGRWWLPVTYTCEIEKPETTSLMFDTREEALEVKPGYKFLS